MEREQEIVAAKNVLRSFLRRGGKHHMHGVRIHRQAAEDNLNRLRALEGLCGRCVNLELRISRLDGKDIVVVGCRNGFIPSELYFNTPMGKTAECSGFKKVT
ncbi:hypothetical protein A3E15_02100 [Candidatus Woesebacteria bacterium RIFCSPHIGHO2_12_FULL_42_9]|uniref:Uncharacterized protein n=2 Tax=Candidatus Woeseibacteriota TaxID=1752722 RepID=A0A1F8AQY0_9BACT|nr:MAG: hypothetical protein A2129_01555 [Candidatus Woesebacteria bacterium GWC1_42_13]OGM53708.1 MAG: hypothetical protein A3E15_02100 [Candidatus Woesebacteria bacterium RIFCSPHIGHO2_12_FULL_42_9]